MIVEFRVANFRSIKDEQVLSFEADNDETHSSRLLRDNRRPKDPLLPSVFVYGGNASGKSNLCRALLAFRNLSVRSATDLNRGDRLEDIVPYRLSRDKAESPSSFEMTILEDGIYWLYTLHATQVGVVYECLKSKTSFNKPRWSTVFERVGNDRAKWVGRMARLNANLFEAVRDNSTVLSKGVSEGVSELAPVYDAISSVRVIRQNIPPRNLERSAFRSCVANPEMKIWLAELARFADIEVDSIKLEKEELSVASLDEKTQAVLRLTNEELPAEIELLKMGFARIRDDGQEVFFDSSEESDGTRRYLALMLEIRKALESGSVLVIDEFDSSLHMLLAQEVRDLMNDPDINIKRAQFVAVTHNGYLLDSSKLRRDQVVLMNHARSEGTQWYALSELDRKPKPDEAFAKRYLYGGYGGVPRIGDLRSLFLKSLEWNCEKEKLKQGFDSA